MNENLITDRPTFVTHLECSMTGERYEADQLHGLSRVPPDQVVWRVGEARGLFLEQEVEPLVAAPAFNVLGDGLRDILAPRTTR